MSDRFSHWVDKSAIGLSGLCLVHCLVGTLLFAIVSAGGSGFFGHEVHQIGLLIAIPLAVVGLATGLMNHGRKVVVLLGAAGIAAMGGALAIGHGFEEMAFTVLGVSLLAAAHLLNMRWTQHRGRRD